MKIKGYGDKTLDKLLKDNKLEDAMKEKLGTKVSIAGNKIKISFVTKEDLNRILEILNIEVE